MAKQHGYINNEIVFRSLMEMNRSIYITPHFKHFENGLICPCCKVRGVRDEIIWVMELLRCILNKPIHIISGYRCYAHNKEVGGAKHSKHLEGKAVDFTCNDSNDLEHLAILLEHWSGVFHYYKCLNFIHLDISGPMRRW